MPNKIEISIPIPTIKEIKSLGKEIPPALKEFIVTDKLSAAESTAAMTFTSISLALSSQGYLIESAAFLAAGLLAGGDYIQREGRQYLTNYRENKKLIREHNKKFPHS